ncbi:MAG: addiction module protein [Candidatus Omnitrophota bacterium]|nr:addiction module protein [Candidatus Omnitrophota bacterium]
MKKISIAEVLKLNIPDRIKWVEDIWDSIAAIPEAVPLTEEQTEELDHRLEIYHKDPTTGSPWTEVKKRILSRE